LIEAMANQLPVIATCVGGVVDLLGPVVEDGSFKVCERGIGVVPGDGEAFAAGLERVIDDSNLRTTLATRGFQFVQAKYRKERLLADIRKLYEEL